jgi:hypothetical protein
MLLNLDARQKAPRLRRYWDSGPIVDYRSDARE